MSSHDQVLTLRCPQCKRKLFKYHKIGNGRIIHCYKSRIQKDYTIHRAGEIWCECGCRIARDEGIAYKMLVYFRKG